jgi:hypothetical protein
MMLSCSCGNHWEVNDDLAGKHVSCFASSRWVLAADPGPANLAAPPLGEARGLDALGRPGPAPLRLPPADYLAQPPAGAHAAVGQGLPHPPTFPNFLV